MACVLEARVGDYVVVHAGVAIAQLDADAAAKTLADLASLPRRLNGRRQKRREK